jgi:hypothetical protein
MKNKDEEARCCDFALGKHLFDPSTSEFIQINGGREYLRKSGVIGLRWSQYHTDEQELAWCLKIYLSESVHMVAYGEDARAIMQAFNLPEDPP